MHQVSIDEGEVALLKFDYTDINIVRFGTISFLSGDELEIKTHTHFRDRSGRPDYESTEIFKRDL